MGWLITDAAYAPRNITEEKREIERIFTPAKDSPVTYEVRLAKKVGTTWYVAVRIEGKDSEQFVMDDKGGFTLCFVILTTGLGGDWGYKDMDETMGPGEAQCPPDVFYLLSDLTDHPRNNYAKEWRETCRSNWPRRTEMTEAGEQTVIPGCEIDDPRTGAVQQELF